MSTNHDEKTQQHIDAICDVFKKEPERILYMGVKPDTITFQFLHREPFNYSIAKPAIALGHNPDNLTVEQVGEGWRLLEKDELSQNRPCTPFIDARVGGKWTETSNGGNQLYYCYRTRLSKEQLALLDKNEGWIPWFEDGEIPSGRVDVVSSMGKQIDGQDSEFWTNVWPHKDHIASIIAYRPAKQPTVVPWDCAEDVPGPVCWLKRIKLGWPCMVTEVDDRRIVVGSNPGLQRLFTELGDWLYSTDRINWFPCNKKSDVKGEK